MTHPTSFDRLLLVGHGSPQAEGNTEFLQFAVQLSDALKIEVQPCFLELATPTIPEGIRLCVAAGAERIAVVPLFLGAAGHHKNDVPVMLAEARETYPTITLKYGTPIGAHAQIVQILADRAAAALAHRPSSDTPIPLSDTAVLLAARGSSDPDSNAEVAKVARLLYEGRDFATVEIGFQKVAKPTIRDGIDRCVRLGAKRVLVLPYLLFSGFVLDDIATTVHHAQQAYPDVDMLVGTPLFPHDGLVAAVAQRYRELVEGTATMTCDSCKYRHPMAGFEHDLGKPQMSHHHHHDHTHHDHTHGHHDHAHHDHAHHEPDHHHRHGPKLKRKPHGPKLKHKPHGPKLKHKPHGPHGAERGDITL